MKRLIPLILILLLALLPPLVSCRGDARAEIENELDAAREENEAKIREEQTVPEPGQLPNEERTEEPESIPQTDGTETEQPEEAQPVKPTEEAQPVKPTFKSDWDGITSSEYTVLGNRYYYYVQAKKGLPGGYITGVYAYVYTDLTQGGMQYVCPDPLCSHDSPIICPYTADSSMPDFCPTEGGLFYFRASEWNNSKWNFNAGIVKADLNKNVLKTVYDAGISTVKLYGAENGVVYFLKIEDFTDKNTRKTVRKNFLIALDVKTDEVLFERIIPDDVWIKEIRGRRIVCSSLKTLIEYDMNFENPKTLFSFEGTGGFGEWYYDENRNEFWFNVRDREQESGQVWHVLSDGTCEKVPLRAEKIYCFQLTNTKIYYSPYDPVKLSEHPRDPNGIVDYTNGKIYSVNRDDPGGEPTLVYDCAGKYYIGEPDTSVYTIFGDDLYFSLLKLTRETDWITEEEYLAFNMAGDYPKVHVNLSTGEEEIYRFD